MHIRNIAWNFSGLAVPLVIAVIAIPFLIPLIGLERFGLLALAWGLIGFAGVFDLGIGRATTYAIAKLRGSSDLGQISVVVHTATSLSLGAGLIGALITTIAVLLGVHTNIRYSDLLSREVTTAAYLVAMAIPVQSVSAMYRGVNEAFENFRAISVVRIGLGAANFAGPLLVALFTTHLGALVATLLLSRLCAFFLYRKLAVACIASHVDQSASVPISQEAFRRVARHLLTFGGWITVSSIVYPFMMQADRVLIGSLVSAEAVAIYVIPLEIVLQSLVLVGAVTTVFFPRMTAMMASNPDEAVSHFYRWLRYVVVLMLVISTSLALALPYALPLWLGESFRGESVLVGQLLCLGLVPYTVGTMYVVLIHARNRSDVTAKAHLMEVPIYLGLLYYAIMHFGLVGAASVWVARVLLDAVVLVMWFLIRCNPKQQLEQ